MLLDIVIAWGISALKVGIGLTGYTVALACKASVVGPHQKMEPIEF